MTDVIDPMLFTYAGETQAEIEARAQRHPSTDPMNVLLDEVTEHGGANATLGLIEDAESHRRAIEVARQKVRDLHSEQPKKEV